MLIFTRVVQASSFTAAAKLLDMPKSSVSRKVSELEDRLGARLLQRTTRQLGLTDVGRVYYERCARIIGEIEEADQAVGNMQAAPCGPLRVTAPLSFSMLGPIVSEFLKKHPTVQIELLCTDRRVDLVEEGFDLAIRAGHLDDSSLVARHLGNFERVLVAAPAYLKQKGTPKTPAELAQHACIAFGFGSTPSLWTLFAGDKRAEVRITPRLSVNDLELMLDAVRSGVGIALMPKFMCSAQLRQKELRQILRDYSSSGTPVHALYPTTRHLSPKVLAFVDLLRAKLHLGERGAAKQIGD